jgi:hypothetical protein
VTSPAKDLANLMSLFEAMFDDDDAPVRGLALFDRARLAAELAARLRAHERTGQEGIGASNAAALLAAHFDDGLQGSEQHRVEIGLTVSPAGLQDAIAGLDFLQNLAGQRLSAPFDLIDAAIGRFWSDHKGEEPALAFDSFHLLAAATDEDPRAILCRSRSGLLTLEIFVGKSEQDQDERLGHLLLTVHPDHRAAYEGRMARMFVVIGDEERVLAEEAVREGEVYSAISLAETDLWGGGAVNVVFGLGKGMR